MPSGGRSYNDPNGRMLGPTMSGPPKDTSAGKDLGRDATNVIAKLGVKPEALYPNANKASINSK